MSSGLDISGPGLAQAATGIRMRSFTGTPEQVREARRFTASMLAHCPGTQDAVLCVSEFAANAVLHSNTRERGRFVVRVEVFAPDYSWVEVEDNGGLWQVPDAVSPAGHGLDLVDKIATDWGVDGDLTGWIAWARIDWPLPGPKADASGATR